MSEEFLKRYVSKISVSDKSSSKYSYKRLTHLYLNGKNIQKIGCLSKCTNLLVLYIHNNLLEEINGLDPLLNLTHLYLQWNKIKKISNLNFLKNLRKLYLAYNEIEILENVDGLTKLEELHLEGQRISNEFKFDFLSLRAISPSLLFLNISKLKLTRIDDLRCLVCLEVLIASENEFADVTDIAYPLGCMPFLRKVDVRGCPAQKDVHYREKITAGTNKLEYLDGKYITSKNRAFIKKIEQFRLERKVKSDPIHSRLKSETPTNKCSKIPSLYLLSNTSDELSFRPWNSSYPIGCMPFLRKVDVRGCPAQKDVHYREKITAEYVDGKSITSKNRAFIKKIEQFRLERKVKSDPIHSRLKSETPTNKSSKIPSLYLLSNSSDELSFRPWNSLHSIQRPRRISRKQIALLKPRSDYQLDRKNIVH